MTSEKKLNNSNSNEVAGNSAEEAELHQPKQISRREALIAAASGAAGLALGGAAIKVAGEVTSDPAHNAEVAVANTDGSESVLATGQYQAGINRPKRPQPHALVTVANLDIAKLPAVMKKLGNTIISLTKNPDPQVFPDGTGDLTILVGLGARALQAFPKGKKLGDTLKMPMYRGDEKLDPILLGGDLLLSINASDPQILEPVYQELTKILPPLTVVWAETAYAQKGKNPSGIGRNPFGFHDGIINPKTPKQLKKDIWIADGPLRGGTICVMRRFLLHTDEFGAHPVPKQERVIGRKKATGIPLSGGTLTSEANITAKTPDGEWVIPTHSHIRAAHPSFIGGEMMLRRSYSVTRKDGETDKPKSFLLFTCFQNNIRTFVATQQRLDEIDDLMNFSTPKSSAAFAILPGFDESHPLGSTLM